MEIARSSPWVATTRWRHASTFVRSSKPLANALVLFLRLGERNSPAFERLLTLCQLRSSDALTFPTHLSPRRIHLRNAYLPSISGSCFACLAPSSSSTSIIKYCQPLISYTKVLVWHNLHNFARNAYPKKTI